MKLGRAHWVPWVALAALGFIAACSDDGTAGGGVDNEAGSGSLAGAGATVHGGGAGGEGLENGGAAGAGSGCVKGSLGEACRDLGLPSCPESPAKVVLWCGPSGLESVSYPSSCGGVSIRVETSYTVAIWHFDENDELVGADLANDTELSDPSCDDDVFRTVVGKSCEATPEQAVESLCSGGAGGAGGAG